MNFHKQKLYALILAGVGLLSLLLPWRSLPFLGSVTNGFSGVGIISLLGVIGVIVASFMGDKTKEYDQNSKMIAMGSFGALALGALFTLLTKYHGVSTNAGLGIWLAIIAGLVGLGWVTGIIKLPNPPPPKS